MPSWPFWRSCSSGPELVGGAVEAADLGVEHVDEPPEQALALVGDLEAVGCDGIGEEDEGFLHGADGFVLVPDLAGVELVPLWGCAVEGGVLADGCGDGLPGGFDDVHNDLLCDG